ncbi:MAG TPA: hypothetical protein VNJ04_02835, partial [Gemmatimonadaceae bacterium]|nr:hypothetical protein [Gemmatimonadaceae bacterium]
LTVEPAAIVPTALSDPAGDLVTVLPLDVVVGVFETVGERDGAGAGRLTTVGAPELVVVRGAPAVLLDAPAVVRDGAGVTVPGVTLPGVTKPGSAPTGTSVSAGWALVSAFASWISRFSDVSCASVSESFFVSAQPAIAITNANASDVLSPEIYCFM